MNACPLLSSTCLTTACFSRKSQVPSFKTAWISNNNILSDSLNKGIYKEIDASRRPLNQVAWPFQKMKGYREKNPPSSPFQALLSFKIHRRARVTRGPLIGDNTHTNSKAANWPSVKGLCFGFHPFRGQGTPLREKTSFLHNKWLWQGIPRSQVSNNYLRAHCLSSR